MRILYGTIVIVLLMTLSEASKKKSSFSSVPWPGFPFVQPPKEYLQPNSQDDDHYYETYDLGEGIDFDNLIDWEDDEEETPESKPDRKRSLAFKQEVSSSMHDFAFDLLSALVQNKTSENIVISPLSIYTALSMLTLGLGGNSKAQALTVLHGQNLGNIHENMEDLYDVLCNGKRDNATLTKANRVFVDKSIRLTKNFKRTMRKSYRVSAKKVDFGGAPQFNRKRINGFVQRHTNNKIKNLAPAGSITSDTKLYIVNALYMKAYWKSPFTETTNGRFRVSDQEEITSDMMTTMGHCSYTFDDELGVRIVRNPMKGRFSMVMIIPNTAGDFSKLEDAEGKRRVRQALETLYDTSKTWLLFCQLSMPKFKIGSTADELVEALQKLGLEDVFTGRADLSEMTPSYRVLYVNDMRHKAFIDVNENGIEGSAATAMSLSQRSMPRPVRVDKPFMFIVRDDDTGATLFTGKVVRPQYN